MFNRCYIVKLFQSYSTFELPMQLIHVLIPELVMTHDIYTFRIFTLINIFYNIVWIISLKVCTMYLIKQGAIQV